MGMVIPYVMLSFGYLVISFVLYLFLNNFLNKRLGQGSLVTLALNAVFFIVWAFVTYSFFSSVWAT